MAMADVRIAHGQEAARQSYSDAMDWYRAGAEAGDPKAQFYLGVAFEEGGQGILDLAAARGWFKKTAKSGHALARYKLAVLLQSGKGGPTDLIKARRLYVLAADQDVVEAKYNLAVMFQDGAGGPANALESAKLFESAARGGVGISFLHLAVLKTRGPSADLIEAMKWAYLAKRAKVDGVDGYISALAPLLSAEQDDDARSRARDWK
jgi:TPR repeat protein